MIEFPIIDSHTHLLDQRRLRYSWAANAPKLQRDFRPHDLTTSARPYVVDGFVFVEVDVDKSLHMDEALWIDALAAEDGRILGGVFSLPLERGRAIEPELARVARLRSARGVRRLLQGEADDFATQPAFLEALRLLPKYEMSFDICIYHPQLGAAIRMARACPEVAFVLDHVAKPGLRAGLLDPWRAQMREMAALPNVVCKLSGLPNEADHATWKREQLRPYLLHAIECFGIDRVMFGGDWPVCELAGGYLKWLDAIDWATEGLTGAERHKIFRENAIRVYRLGA